MNIKEKINIFSECRDYGIPLWQCPQFLFTVMGLIIIFTITVSYLVGIRLIAEPALVFLIDAVIAVILLIISFTITRTFERVVEASRMKSEFINIASHQLRAPLTNLKWGIEFLGIEKIDLSREKKEEYFNNLQENVARMVELVDDLLVVSRLERGALPDIKKEINLREMVENLIARFKVFAEASNVELELIAEPNLPKVFMDNSQLKLVVENLIDNAIRYSKEKGEIKIYLKKKGKTHNLLVVQDKGMGIPEEEKKHIFQKFFRARNANKRKTRGSGLGLYVVKSIVEKAGGKIWFKSEEGKGTSFFVALPIKHK